MLNTILNVDSFYMPKNSLKPTPISLAASVRQLCKQFYLTKQPVIQRDTIALKFPVVFCVFS